MGQARNRGTFEERKAQAIAAGRIKTKREPAGGFGMGGIYGLMASMFMRRQMISRKRPR